MFIDLPPIMSWKERGKFDYWIYEVYSFELDENIAWTCLIFGVIHKDSGIIPEFLPHTQILYSLLPNVTTGWFIWEIFTRIVSQQTCFMCETFFVKIFQMNQQVVTFGSREYTVVQVVDCKLASQRLFKPSVPIRGGLSPNVSTIKP